MEGLSKKEKGFVRDWIKTGNSTQAALKHYDIRGKNPAAIASVIGAENLAKPRIKNAIQSIIDKIPEEDLLKTHLEGLKAGKKIYKNNNASGEIEEVGYEPDYATRHKYLDTAYKIKGFYKDEDDKKNINIVVPVLVKFLNKDEDKTSDNRDTNRVS